MLHAGLDLSRRRLDVCLVDDAGELAARIAAAPDADGLRHLVMRVSAGRVRAVTRVDERGAVRARHARGAGLGGASAAGSCRRRCSSAGVVFWSRLHGLVSLELDGHFDSMQIDPELLYWVEPAVLGGAT